MLDLKYEPTVTNRYTEHDFQRKMQCPETRQRFENFRRECNWNAVTVGQLFENKLPESMTTQEAIQSIGDLPAQGWAIDTIMADVLESTTYRSFNKQFANRITAPEGLPRLWYREYSRWELPQIVGETDIFEAPDSERETRYVDFYTIGDKVMRSWQSIKDNALDELQMDTRAIGSMIGLLEDRFAVNALRHATSDLPGVTTNRDMYNNWVDIYGVNPEIYFASFLRYRANMSGPTAESHPYLNSLIRQALLNQYSANVLLVPASVYADLVSQISWASNNTLLSNHFWANSRILDTGGIEVMGGMTIYRINSGWWENDQPCTDEWTETTDCYLIDTKMGGVTMADKEPLQLINWADNDRRVDQMVIYERMNAFVRNPRSVYRLTLHDAEDPYSS